MSERPKVINFQEEKDRRALARANETLAKEEADTFDFSGLADKDGDSEYAFGPEDACGYAQNLLILLDTGRDIMLREYQKWTDMDEDSRIEDVEQVFERNRAIRKESLERVADDLLIRILEDHKNGRGEHGFATVVAAAEVLLGRIT